MQEAQPTPGAPAARVVDERHRRPGPANQVTGHDAAFAMVASHMSIALIGGFASALLTACPLSGCTPPKGKVVSAVQLTLGRNMPVRAPALRSTTRERRRRPGPATQAVGIVGIDVNQAMVADEATTGARFTRLTHGTVPDRRSLAVPGICAQRMRAEMITARPIPANVQSDEQPNRRRPHAARSTAIARATSPCSGRPVSHRRCPRVGRRCGCVSISPAAALDLRPGTPGSSLRYPRGN